MALAKDFKFCTLIGHEKQSFGLTNSPSNRCGNPFSFFEVINNRKWCKTESQLQWKTGRKSCMAYWMARLPMTLSEVEGYVCCFKPL